MKIIVLGGDGFCGWPTALHLSKQGNEVHIFDNLSRRKIDIDLETNSLTPIETVQNRLKTWKNVTQNEIIFHKIDVSLNYSKLLSLINEIKPDSIVHFAEQRSAPYSMKSSKEKRYTINNNINATNNVLSAIVESKLDVHLVHLGTMGVYGYGGVNLSIPEGYLKVNIKDENGNFIEKEIMYPPMPGSIYHLTKTQDALMFDFYNRNNKLRITDLHQGIVWGTQTEETKLDEALINRFDYDGDYGTVLNRFIMQSAIDHPLTVYGVGGQTRAFIHIKDSVACINLAIKNPPKTLSRVKIFNQTTETHKVIDLANLISKITGAKIKLYDNPRNEAPENELKVINKNFSDLGLKPTYLNEGLLEEVSNIAKKYIHRCDLDKIITTSYWNN